jgi:membrane protein implicated in regulation of membrane protease activity
MSSLLIFWLAVGIGFLIIEIITVTFYGLALSIAGFVVAGFVWYTNATEISLIQGILFAIVSFFTSFYLPGLLTPK